MEKFQEFRAEYEARFGKFPAADNTAPIWAAFVHRIPLDKISPLIDAVGEAWKRASPPRLQAFYNAWNAIRPKREDQQPQESCAHCDGTGYMRFLCRYRKHPETGVKQYVVGPRGEGVLAVYTTPCVCSRGQRIADRGSCHMSKDFRFQVRDWLGTQGDEATTVGFVKRWQDKEKGPCTAPDAAAYWRHLVREANTRSTDT